MPRGKAQLWDAGGIRQSLKRQRAGSVRNSLAEPIRAGQRRVIYGSGPKQTRPTSSQNWILSLFSEGPSTQFELRSARHPRSMGMWRLHDRLREFRRIYFVFSS